MQCCNDPILGLLCCLSIISLGVPAFGFADAAEKGFAGSSSTEGPQKSGLRSDSRQKSLSVIAMGWLKGKFTGNHRFSHEKWDVPVIFPSNQSIDHSNKFRSWMICIPIFGWMAAAGCLVGFEQQLILPCLSGSFSRRLSTNARTYEAHEIPKVKVPSRPCSSDRSGKVCLIRFANYVFMGLGMV